MPAPSLKQPKRISKLYQLLAAPKEPFARLAQHSAVMPSLCSFQIMHWKDRLCVRNQLDVNIKLPFRNSVLAGDKFQTLLYFSCMAKRLEREKIQFYIFIFQALSRLSILELFSLCRHTTITTNI